MVERLSCPEYEALKEESLRGWKTWNVNSVLSYVHMPDGLSLSLGIKEYRSGIYLKDALIGRFPKNEQDDETEQLFPEYHAFDDSYTSIRMDWCGMRLRIETAVRNDELYILVTPLKNQVKAPLLVLEGGHMWNRPGFVGRDGNALITSAGRVVNGSQEHCDADANIPATGPYLAAALNGPVGFKVSDRLENRVTLLAEIETVVAESKEAMLSQHDSKSALNWAHEAIESAVSWDSVYDSIHDRVISPVSRLWSIRKGGYVLFCWDNFFAGYMAADGNKFLAYSNLIEILNERTENLFVPNMACGTGQKTEDRSQPPVGARMLLEVYEKYGDKWIVEMMFPALVRWNTWFVEHRMTAEGTFCWGSDPAEVKFGNEWELNGVNERYGAALESGLDNSPMYDDIPFNAETHMLELEDVGLTGLFIMDCGALIRLAEILGDTETALLMKERKELAEKGLERLWDEENGFYYNRRTDTGEFSRRISPTNFYAMFSDKISMEHMRRMIDEHYFNPEEFYGDWMLPSIARNDPAYFDQDYWRGRVWAPMNFLVYLAFEQQGLRRECADLSEKSRKIFLKEWDEKHHIHENYNSITGEGCDVPNSDKFYHWGALLAAIAIRENILNN